MITVIKLSYTFFDDAGRIFMCVEADADSFNATHVAMGAPRFLVGKSDVFTEYVDLSQTPPVIAPRPSMSVSLDGSTLKGVPAGALVRIGGVSYPADGTDIELAFDTPAARKIDVENFPYMDWAWNYAP
jgi:hypothetical protein